MTAAWRVRHAHPETRLLVIPRSAAEALVHARFEDISDFLQPGDLLVANDASTLPASLQGTHGPTGGKIEVRLAASRSSEASDPRRWLAIFFGEGSWRTPTENRRPPPRLQIGDEISFIGGVLRARIVEMRDPSPRLAEIEFYGNRPEVWRGLYRAGRPIQYSHLREDLELWDVQTALAGGPPVALEAPSAAFPLSWERVAALQGKGIGLITLTHAAGISSTGDPELDRRLPLPERFWIPERTALAVSRARAENRAVIALGTSVTRALESAVDERGNVQSGSGLATLLIQPTHRLRIVDGIVSGFHESGASHLELLGAFFSDSNRLAAAYQDAESLGYLGHEFGDACLIR